MPTNLAKARLRRSLKRRILELDPAHRAAEDAALLRRFDSLPGFARAATVCLYVGALPEEVPTLAMIEEALRQGKRLVLPRVDREGRRLRLFVVEDLIRDLEAGSLGVPEPRVSLSEVPSQAVDWVLVPGLGFDERCYRLGRGAGYYDRLLPTLRTGTPCWALAYDEQWVDDLPIESHDVPIDGVVSPSREVRRDANET